MSNYKFVGKGVPNIEAPEKVTGKAKYTTDLNFSGMLWGKILRSPINHGKIKKIDVGRAIELPGVRAVITGKDVPRIKFGFGERPGDKDILAQDKVRFKGDEVAAVAAIDEETAEEALQLIEVEYEEIPAVFDPEEATLPGTPQIHEDSVNNIPFRLQFQKGDVGRAFAEADLIVEDHFRTQRVHQSYLEPWACVASWDDQGRLNLWTGSQNSSGIRLMLAKVLELPVSRVRIIQPYIGGAFGSKSVLNSIFPASAILSRLTGRPVKMVYGREEEYFASRPRFSGVFNAKTAVKKDGKILGRELKFIFDCGAYMDIAPANLTVCCHRAENLYRIPAAKYDAFLTYTNKSPTGAYSGYGNPQLTFVWESQMDIIAEKLGIDPAELRLKNAIRSGDTTLHGYKITSCGLSESIEQCVRLSHWKEKREKKLQGRGIGMACVMHHVDDRHSNGFAGSKAIIEIWEDGKVVILSGEGEYGQGVHTVFAQIVAEVLGVSLDDILVRNIDTDVSPYALGPWGLRVTMSGGIAVQRAAIDAKEKLLRLAGELLETDPKDLELREGKIFVQGSPDRFLTIAEVAKEGLYRKEGGLIRGYGLEEPNTGKMDPLKQTNPCSTYCFGTQVIEVEVNRETGQVKILNVTSGNDVGTPLNPPAMEGQVEGAILQGIGFSLSEEMIYSNGHLLNPSLMTSKVPNIFDMPEEEIFFTKTYDPYGPFGAKGGASLAQSTAAAAIANAIYDAVGVRIKELPITPEKVLSALRGRNLNQETN
jgi:CO/xanthine dehydrogenase Mo-binding subunit